MRRAVLLSFLAISACHPQTGELVHGATLGAEVEAPAPGRRSYSTTVSPDPLIGSLRLDAVQRGIDQASAAAHVPLAGDGRLALLSAWLAERMGSGATLPPLEVTRFFAWHLGLAEQTPQVVLIGVPDAASTASAVADVVGGYLRRQPYHAYGAAVVDRQGLGIVVVALAARPFTMEDFPRAYADAGSRTLRGRLADGYTDPVIELRGPDGSTERLAASSGPTFEVALPLQSTGPYEVRLWATGASGASVLARFPVYVGVDPPTRVRVGADEPVGVATTAEAVGSDLLTRLNAARAEQGVPTLTVLNDLASVARAHSVDMVEHDFISHTSPTTGSPADRLRAASLSSGLLLENLGRGPDSAAVHASLLASPQHRANMLNRDVTHVGIGVAPRTEGGQTTWVVTEVFIRMTRAIDTLRAPDILLAEINRARAARHAPAAQLDSNLSSAAAAAAQAYFDDASQSQQDVMDDATASVRRFAIAYRRVGGVMAVVTSLDEAATLEPTFDPSVGFLGVGVAQGTRADIPPNSIVVVYLLAWSR